MFYLPFVRADVLFLVEMILLCRHHRLRLECVRPNPCEFRVDSAESFAESHLECLGNRKQTNYALYCAYGRTGVPVCGGPQALDACVHTLGELAAALAGLSAHQQVTGHFSVTPSFRPTLRHP